MSGWGWSMNSRVNFAYEVACSERPSLIANQTYRNRRTKMIKVFAASLLLALNCAKAEAVNQVETGTPVLPRTDRTGQNST